MGRRGAEIKRLSLSLPSLPFYGVRTDMNAGRRRERSRRSGTDERRRDGGGGPFLRFRLLARPIRATYFSMYSSTSSFSERTA